MSPQRGKRQPVAIQQAIAEYAAIPGYTAEAIRREIEARFGPETPSKRTVQGMVKQIRQATDRDRSDTWSVLEDDTGEPRIVLDALAAALTQTRGGVGSISKAEARLVVKVARSAPELPPYQWLRFARLYAVRQALGWPASDLDALLALAPWRDEGEEGWTLYRRSVREGWIAEAPGGLVGDLGGSWLSFGSFALTMDAIDPGGHERQRAIRASKPRRSRDLEIAVDLDGRDVTLKE